VLLVTRDCYHIQSAEMHTSIRLFPVQETTWTCTQPHLGILRVLKLEQRQARRVAWELEKISRSLQPTLLRFLELPGVGRIVEDGGEKGWTCGPQRKGSRISNFSSSKLRVESPQLHTIYLFLSPARKRNPPSSALQISGYDMSPPCTQPVSWSCVLVQSTHSLGVRDKMRTK